MDTECTAVGEEPLRVLAFEAWDSGSHRTVRESISRHAHHDWTWVTLPRGHWRWRLRMGAVELADAARSMTVQGAVDYDMLFATSMVSLADLVAMLPAKLQGLPRVFYVHENQAAYPAAGGQRDHRDDHLALTNLNSMLVADHVLWNSAWNRDSFIQGIGKVLTHARGGVPKGLVERVLERSSIAWPPVETPRSTDRQVLHNAEAARNRGLVLVTWPHRWEHDKGPDELLELDRRARGVIDLGWILLGEQFARRPASLDTLVSQAGDRIIHAGHAPREEYETWLCEADWVCSTAHHEYFGIAVVEALLAGCMPWLPDRLSYPEIVGESLIGHTPATAGPLSRWAAQLDMLQERLARAKGPHAVQHIERALTQCASGCRR